MMLKLAQMMKRPKTAMWYFYHSGFAGCKNTTINEIDLHNKWRLRCLYYFPLEVLKTGAKSGFLWCFCHIAMKPKLFSFFIAEKIQQRFYGVKVDPLPI